MARESTYPQSQTQGFSPETTGSLLIIVATEEELSPLAAQVQRPEHSIRGRSRSIEGNIKEIPARLILSGPGVLNTVQALTAAIERSRPSMILMTGCAGAFQQAGMAVGDIGVAAEEIDAHLGIEGETTDAPPAPLPFPVLRAEGMEIRGRYPLHPMAEDVRWRLSRRFEGESVQVKAGPFLTVSTVTASDKRADMLYHAFGPLMENMEGAGGAHVAALYRIPFLEIRCASNRVGNRNRSAWELSAAFDRCAEAVLALADFFKERINP